MSRETEIAWAAGLFEGEGTIWARPSGYPTLSLPSTDEDVVRRFALLVGVGKVYGPMVNRKNSFAKKPQWRWEIYGRENALMVWDMFRPYLGARRHEKFASVIREMGVRKRARAAPCGTRSGANRHRRLGTPLCGACRESERLRALTRRG